MKCSYNKHSSKNVGARNRSRSYSGGGTTLKTLYEEMTDDDGGDSDDQHDDDESDSDLLDYSSSDLSYENFEFGKDETITLGSETIDTMTTSIDETSTVSSATTTTNTRTMINTTFSWEESARGGGSTYGTSTIDASTVTTMDSARFRPQYFCSGTSGVDLLFRKFRMEVKGGLQDAAASISEIFHAFTLSEKDIREVTKRIHKAKRQFGE